jgi:hypothetical protein
MPARYDAWDAWRILGLRMPGSESPGVAPGVASTMHKGAFSDTEPLWSPHNPLFWFGVVLLVTGFAAASTELRVGPFRAKVGAGKE